MKFPSASSFIVSECKLFTCGDIEAQHFSAFQTCISPMSINVTVFQFDIDVKCHDCCWPYQDCPKTKLVGLSQSTCCSCSITYTVGFPRFSTPAVTVCPVLKAVLPDIKCSNVKPANCVLREVMIHTWYTCCYGSGVSASITHCHRYIKGYNKVLTVGHTTDYSLFAIWATINMRRWNKM